MGNLKCGIYRKRLIVDQNGRKFATWGPIVNIWKVLLIPDSFSLVWGHSVHFAILQFFLILRSSLNIHSVYPKFIQCIIIIRAVTFLAICQNCKHYGILKYSLII